MQSSIGDLPFINATPLMSQALTSRPIYTHQTPLSTRRLPIYPSLVDDLVSKWAHELRLNISYTKSIARVTKVGIGNKYGIYLGEMDYCPRIKYFIMWVISITVRASNISCFVGSSFGTAEAHPLRIQRVL